MQMVVLEGVTLVKPLADGRDYTAGDLIDLPASVAEDWHRRGWVRVPIEIMLPPVVEQTEWTSESRRQPKGRNA